MSARSSETPKYNNNLNFMLIMSIDKINNSSNQIVTGFPDVQ